MTTREEVIRLAKESRFHVDEDDSSIWDHDDYVAEDEDGRIDIADKIERLIQLAKNEAYREAAKVCGDMYMGGNIREDKQSKRCEAAILNLVKE